jgi:hypothetical protein
VAFSATTAEFGCRNFESAPPKPPASCGGFVEIWLNGRIVWQGAEENIPPASSSKTSILSHRQPDV